MRSIFKTTVIALLLANSALLFPQNNKIDRSPETRKDIANVYYKSQYTLFDLFTDEPIFPSSNGKYHIYISSNENRYPKEFEGSKYELENCLFYKFKNYQNCKDWCDGKTAIKVSTDNSREDVSNQKIYNNQQIADNNTKNQIPTNLLAVILDKEDSLSDGGWINDVKNKTLAYTDKNRAKRYFEWDGKKSTKMEGFLEFKNYINGFGNCRVYDYNNSKYTDTGIDNFIYTYTGNVIDGKFEGHGQYTYADGSILEGEFSNSRINGLCVKTHLDGSRSECFYTDGKRNGLLTVKFSYGLIFTANYNNGKLDNNSAKFKFSNGDLYEGSINNKLEYDGSGVLTYADGRKYVGQFKNGLRNGLATYTFSDGKKYVGEFKNDIITGKGTISYPDGSKYEGDWKNGFYDGQGTLIYESGDKYIGHWKEGKFSGQGKLIQGDNTYEGEWSDSKLNGQGTCTTKGGMKYVGEWKNSKKNGQGTNTLPDGNKYVGNWNNDTIDGNGIFTFPDGSNYEGMFKDGKYNGQGKYTSADGKNIYMGEWVNNNKEGQGTYTFGDGSKYVGEWKNDKFNGQGIIYSVNGSISKDGIWENGNFIKSNADIDKERMREEKLADDQRIKEEKERIKEEKRKENEDSENFVKALNVLLKIDETGSRNLEKRTGRCANCEGFGYNVCTNCNGTGLSKYDNHLCSYCNGRGKKICNRCNGTGRPPKH